MSWPNRDRDKTQSRIASDIWTHIQPRGHLGRMASPVLYSTNPWIAVDIAMRYRGGIFFAWVCECFDVRSASPGTAAASIAPTSNPCRIYINLLEESKAGDGHSGLIKGYKKTFTRLARDWQSGGLLTQDHCDEIIAAIRAPAWTIWRPVLYVIPREAIERAGRLVSVPRRDRAAHGPELQVTDLRRDEFDIIELDIR